MTTAADRRAPDMLAKAQLARTCNELGEPWPAWSTGEQLAVAVLLQDTDTMVGLGYTEHDALQRLRRTYGFHQLATATQWFADLRARL